MSKAPSLRSHDVGRRYERRRRPFIDVLHIPDISEAVERASEQLRIGLMKAMESNKCDEEGNLIDTTPKTKKKKINEKPKGPTDSHQLYSMLTTRVQKENEKKVAAMREARQRGESVDLAINNPKTQIVHKKSRMIATSKSVSTSENETKPKVSAAQALVSSAGIVPDIPTAKSSSFPPSSNASSISRNNAKMPVSHSWKSNAKAGPGILSKRQRPESTTQDNGPVQSAPKRPAPTTLASIMAIAANETPTRPRKSEAPQGPKRSSSFVSNSSKISALRANEARSKAIDTSNYVHSRKAAPKVSSSTRTLFDTMKKSSSRLPIARPLPSSVRKLTPLNRSSSAVSRTVVEAENRLAAHTIARRNANDGGMFLVRDTTGTGGAGRSLLPMVPSLSSRGGQSTFNNRTILFPPGLDAIGTVRPNGYESTPKGLKPVVTPDSKIPPKVPMKLRQATAEKLFAAWRDIHKLPEMEALMKALRAEQTMFAQAAGKIDYRAAALSQLSQLKSVNKGKDASSKDNGGSSKR